MHKQVAGRDTIVVGASMGGIDALKRLVAGLPEDLQAAVFVVQHVAADAPAALAEVLDRAGPLRAVTATDLVPIETGRIYVAAPNRHLLVRDGHLVVTHGPRENRMRPAIDPLFRSAAVARRSRAVGVVLTGMLDDGASGLDAIKRCGGVAVVQSPEDAAYPEMPLAALSATNPDYVVPLEEMGPLLTRLVQEPAPEPPPTPRDLQMEVLIAERAVVNVHGEDALGTPAPYSCPECGGSLWEIDDEHVCRYRCRVGHAFSARTLLHDQEQVVEQALWTALRTLEERTNMLSRMVRDERAAGRARTVALYQERLEESMGHAESIRNFLMRGGHRVGETSVSVEQA